MYCDSKMLGRAVLTFLDLLRGVYTTTTRAVRKRIGANNHTVPRIYHAGQDIIVHPYCIYINAIDTCCEGSR